MFGADVGRTALPKIGHRSPKGLIPPLTLRLAECPVAGAPQREAGNDDGRQRHKESYRETEHESILTRLSDLSELSGID